MAFKVPEESKRDELYSVIPEGVDVLVTHGPPHGMLDVVVDGSHVGCKALGRAVARVAPQYHVFGHIHESYGVAHTGIAVESVDGSIVTQVDRGTVFVNAAICDENYDAVHAPVVIDVAVRTPL